MDRGDLRVGCKQSLGVEKAGHLGNSIQEFPPNSFGGKEFIL